LLVRKIIKIYSGCELESLVLAKFYLILHPSQESKKEVTSQSYLTQTSNKC
jgi:hypothetical protein